MKHIVLMVTVASVMAAMMLALEGAAVAGALATTATSAQEEVVTVEVGPTAKLIEEG
jgi:hypothetical protein